MQLRQAAMRQEQALIERFAQEAEKLHQRVTQLRAEELQLLARDARLAPNNTDVLYRYGLALYLNGRQEEAAQVLESGAAKEQHSPRFLYALALLYQKLKQYDKAIEKARRLIELSPTNTDYQSLLESLQKEQGIPSSSP
jgi:tetratricopeptide (TPR) repeat protein